MVKRIHIALAVRDIAATVEDYSARLGTQPCLVVPGEYALWRTSTVNFSVRQDSGCEVGELRHLGWEEDSAPGATVETDCNGIVWEHFSARQQAEEIREIWPEVNHFVEK